MIKKSKNGLTQAISMLLFIMITIIAVIIISAIILNRIKVAKEQVETLSILGIEELEIKKAVGDFRNGGIIDITIQRTFSAAEKSTTKKEEISEEKIPVDIVLVLDRSGSMRQSGWILETSLSPTYTTTLAVPVDAYSSTYSFNVPAGTQRLAVAINWSKVAGFDGSEGSELAMNLRRPSGSWIANNGNRPDALSGIVDPPDSVGAASEYFSGISTKPQYFYIENPPSGSWEVKVYGWNLRPKSGPPPSQDILVQVYIGDSSSLNKSITVLSSDLVKSASKDFVDGLSEQDRAAIVRFGSCAHAELTQSLTSDKALVKNAIDNIGSEGGTCINEGIDTARQHLTAAGDPGAFKVITVLTDGQNDLGPNPVIASAQQAKDLNFTIFTIGLTNFVDENMLKAVATKPEYYYYSDFDKLDEIYQQLSQQIQTIRETRTVDISLIMVFLNESSSCQKEISSSELPELGARKTFSLNLNGCIQNVTKIEIHAKMKNKIGPTIDIIEVKP